MAEASGSDKRSIQQQASAMASSVLSQEKIVTYLRSLDVPLGEDEQAKTLADLIDSLQSSRQELVAHFEFLEVAHDYGWDAAKIYREEPDETTSKRIQAAVSKAKKKKEADEKEKKKKKQKKSRSSSSSSRSSSNKRRRVDSDKPSCYHSYSSCCTQSHCHSSDQQPYQYRQFRSGQNLPCIRCGDTAHHWRQCPKPATK